MMLGAYHLRHILPLGTGSAKPCTPMWAEQGTDMKKVLIALLALALAGCGKQPSADALTAAVASAQSADQAARAASAAANQAAIKNVLSGWDYYAKPSEMITDGVNHFASITSRNSVDFSFPYSGQQNATLVIRKMAGADDPGYEAIIFIDRGQLLSGDQGDIEAKLDDAPPISFGADAPDDNSTTALFFDNGVKVDAKRAKNGHMVFTDTLPLQQFIQDMQRATTLKVRVTAYQNGSPTFIFDISGFSLAKLNASNVALSNVAASPPAVASSVR